MSFASEDSISSSTMLTVSPPAVIRTQKVSNALETCSQTFFDISKEIEEKFDFLGDLINALTSYSDGSKVLSGFVSLRNGIFEQLDLFEDLHLNYKGFESSVISSTGKARNFLMGSLVILVPKIEQQTLGHCSSYLQETKKIIQQINDNWEDEVHLLL